MHNTEILNELIADCKLQVTKFGVRFILKEDIMQLKELESPATAMVRSLFGDTFSPSAQLSSDASTFLCFCQFLINHDLNRSVTTFICDYGKQQYALVDMHKFVKRLIEINQEVLCECKEEWSHTELFPLFYDYYRIIHGTFELYNDLLRLLKDASDSWLSVKLALEQILAKITTDNDYSYREMQEQLNDLEASEGIRFCNNFITKFVFYCKQTVVFSRHLHEEIHDIKNFKSVNTLEKVSSIMIAGIFSILATYMCTDKLSQEMKGVGSNSMLSHLIHSLLYNQVEWFPDKRFPAKESYGRELRIWEFIDCATVVQELKMKMARFAFFTRENEKEMLIAINKLEKMVDNISVTIEDMYRHAHLYSLQLREAGITSNQFIVDSNLQLSVAGVRFTPPCEEQQFESPVSEAMTIMYRATLSLIHTGLQWYIHPCEEKDADSSSLLSCYSRIHDNTTNIIKTISRPHYRRSGMYFLDCANTLITCIHSINQEGFTVLSECKQEWRHHPHLFHLVSDYHKVCLQTSRLYNDFVWLLKDQCDIGMGAILRLKEAVVNCRQDDDYQNSEKMILGFDDGSFTLSGDFMKSLAYICKQTVGFTRQFNEDISELKSVKVLAKVSSGLIAGVFSVMAAYMVELKYFHWMEEKSLTCLWLHVNRCFSWKSPLKKIGRMANNDILGIDLCLSEVMHKVKTFLWYMRLRSEGNFLACKKNMMHEINMAAMEMDKLLVTIEEMRSHADTVNDDIMKAGISLELISDNHMLPVKHKRSPSH